MVAGDARGERLPQLRRQPLVSRPVFPGVQQGCLKARLGVGELKGPRFRTALKAWFLRTCREYGFNSIGVHNSPAVANAPQPSMPYLQPIRFVDIPHWKTDVPTTTSSMSLPASSRAAAIGWRAISPRPQGTILPAWLCHDGLPAADGGGLPRAARRDRRGSPQVAYRLAAPLAEPGLASSRKVGPTSRPCGLSIGERSATSTRRTALGSTRSERSPPPSAGGRERICRTATNPAIMSRSCSASWPSTTGPAREAVRRHDPNHMFIGDKLNANTDALDTVLPVTSRFTDIVFYQMYARYEVQRPGLDRWSRLVDKPFVNGDSAFTMITPTMPRPTGLSPTVSSSAQTGRSSSSAARLRVRNSWAGIIAA